MWVVDVMIHLRSRMPFGVRALPLIWGSPQDTTSRFWMSVVASRMPLSSLQQGSSVTPSTCIFLTAQDSESSQNLGGILFPGHSALPRILSLVEPHFLM